MDDLEGGISDYIEEPDLLDFMEDFKKDFKEDFKEDFMEDFVEEESIETYSDQTSEIVTVGGAEHSATGLVEFALGGLEIFGGFEKASSGLPAKGSVSKFLQKHAGTPTLARLACGSICASVSKASIAGNANKNVHGGTETRALLLGRMAVDKDFDEFDPEDLRDALELALDISLYLKRHKTAKTLRELISELAQLASLLVAQQAGEEDARSIVGSLSNRLARLEKIHAKFAAIAGELTP